MSFDRTGQSCYFWSPMVAFTHVMHYLEEHVAWHPFNKTTRLCIVWLQGRWWLLCCGKTFSQVSTLSYGTCWVWSNIFTGIRFATVAVQSHHFAYQALYSMLQTSYCQEISTGGTVYSLAGSGSMDWIPFLSNILRPRSIIKRNCSWQ